MENLFVKTFEEFNEVSSEVEVLDEGLVEFATEEVSEGLADFLKGVNWYKKNWKIAFGYYKAMNNPAGMKTVAKLGTQEENSGWKFTPGKNLDAFRNQLDFIHRAVSGAVRAAVFRRRCWARRLTGRCRWWFLGML